jgi:predicted Zn-dependent peptidase
MINYLTHTFVNGLRIVHKPIESSVSYCGFIVNAGTRDEASDQYGMAHFIEHMLFKGTDKRRSCHIINRMENVGGELNAYTNKEETVVYSIFLEQHFDRAIELLSDVMFHSCFPRQEIEKEVDVIIDEIRSYEDSPSELIFDEFENLVFDNSEMGHNILGDVDSLLKFNTRMAKSFVEKFYIPSNMVFFSLGKTDFKKVLHYAEKYLSDIQGTVAYKGQRLKPADIQPVSKKDDKETSQAHVLIGGRSYSLFDRNRSPLNLLNNILGGPGMNSRLNISLREKRGYVYNVDSSVTAYTDTGITSIYFGCDKKNIERCVSLVNKELNKLRTKKLTANQLHAAKKQLTGQIGVMRDNHENLALSLGKNFLHHNHFNTLEETFEKIDSVTAEQLLAISNEIFDEKGLFTLIYD